MVNIFYNLACDFRISPIRFLPDILVAIKTNNKELSACLEKISVNYKEISIEAIKMRASYRYKSIQNGMGDLYENSKKRLIYVGQTEGDSSLIYNGKLMKITDFIKKIELYSFGRELCYLVHPSASIEHINYEIEILKKINGKCTIILKNSYELISLETDDFYIEISSGLLQEVSYFGKKSISLIPPICIIQKDNSFEDVYYQIPLDTFLSEEFLSNLLDLKMDIKKININEIKPNQLRFLHDVWWGYADFLLKPNHILNSLLLEIRNTNVSINGIKQILNHLTRNISKKNLKIVNKEILKYSWYWNDKNSRVRFENGKVYLNELKEGDFIILENAKAPLFVVLWTSGWIDFCTLSENNKIMNFVNQEYKIGIAYKEID